MIRMGLKGLAPFQAIERAVVDGNGISGVFFSSG
jgi:hypothetical protein